MALLKNAIGCSKFCWFFYNKTPTIVCSKAKENTKNSLEKSRLTNIGASTNAVLMSSKDFLYSIVHLTSFSFFSIFVIDLAIFAKLEMNHIRKLTFPRNE